MSWLKLMTQYKEKAKQSSQFPTLGLFAYPTLQAADILLYRATTVPVGDDQKQHLELARHIATTFNSQYECDFFPSPRELLTPNGARIMSLRNGMVKMSKSDVSDMSRINLSDDADTILRKVTKSKTDSSGTVAYDPINRPEISNLITIFSTITNRSIDDIVEEYSSKNYRDFKLLLADVIIAEITPIGAELKKLMDDSSYLQQVLDDGALVAKEIAQKTMQEVSKLVGISDSLR
uniref:tryptophan--tRNA ligase n=1 Tax=Hirondellea gigas TaxID=1518452 RepID=A0A6A7GB98_9CRUS